MIKALAVYVHVNSGGEGAAPAATPALAATAPKPTGQ
jgi:hypothetical protein